MKDGGLDKEALPAYDPTVQTLELLDLSGAVPGVG